MNSAEALAERLDRLERQNRRIRWFAVFVLAAAVLVGLSMGFRSQEATALAAEAPAKRVVEAEEFHLVDSNGSLRAVLSVMKNNEVRLGFWGAKGKLQAVLTAGDTSGLALCDATGKLRVALAASSSGQELSFYNAAGEVLWSAPSAPATGGGAADKPTRESQPPRSEATTGQPWKNPENWSRLREGMTESQVISLLGQPTGRNTYPALNSVSLWYGFGKVELDYQTRRVTGWDAK